MSIFSKMGKAVKKGLKQVSLKNVVKIGTPLLSAIPVVGGIAQNVVSNISAAHEAKKQEQQAIEQGNAEMAEYYRQLAEQQAKLSGAQVGQQVGGVINAFTKGVTNEAIAQTSQTAKQVVGNIGAQAVDETMIAWFKNHLTTIILVIAGFVGAIWFFFFKKKPKKVNSLR